MARQKNHLRLFKPKKKSLPAGLYELDIIDLADDGRGVAKYNGKTVFIESALPGETVKAKFIDSRKSFNVAQLVELVKSSVDRVQPGCPYFAECGGCSLQHLNVQKQIAYKNKRLKALFEPLEKQQQKIIEWQPAITANPEHYRHRVRLTVVANKQGLSLGFKKKRSHNIIAIDQCLIADTAINQLLPVLQAELAKLKKRSVLAEVVVSVGANAELALQLVCKTLLPPGDIDLLSGFAEQYQLLTIATLLDQPYGQAFFSTDRQVMKYQVTEQLALDYEVRDFTQVNPLINQLMLERALQWLVLGDHAIVADFFCGIGNLSLPIAVKAQRVIGYELVQPMVDKAASNASLNKLANARFVQSDLFASTIELDEGVNIAVFDPPRAGAQQLAEHIPCQRLQQLLYISCNPETLCRDAELLLAKGMRIKKACLVDMFPHTQHMEAMMLFESG